MKLNTLIKIFAAIIVLGIILPIGFFYFVTITSSPTTQVLGEKRISSIKFDKYNSITLNDKNYDLEINGQHFDIKKDELIKSLMTNESELNKSPFVIIVNPTIKYEQIVMTLDAVSIANIKNYELVSE